MTSSRRKGKCGELEVAALLRDLLGTGVGRNPQPGSRWRPRPPRAAGVVGRWKQATDQANGAKPALLYRVDRRPWRAVVALADAVPGFEGQARDAVTWTLETSLEVFAALVREGLRPVVEPVEAPP